VTATTLPDEGPWGLRDTRVLVAGAGGIGAAAIAGYLAAGARLVVVDRDEARLADVASRHVSTPDRLQTIRADLATAGAGERVVTETVGMLGGLDVLLHCVGINDRRPVLELTEDDWDRVLRINLGSAFGLAQAAGRQMVAQRSGRIVMLSSVSGLLAHQKHAPYAASKGGINQMMRVMAAEWAASGVTVNAIAPGYIETQLTEEYLQGPGVREGLTRLVPAGRLGVPSEVVGPILFLSSPHASFVTGHVLYVDGGRTLV